MNNSDAQKIEAHLNHFNPIDVMKMSGQEIRHSNILAWLMDPKETHGLIDRFLKSFLSEALVGEFAKGGISAMDVIQADLRDAEVRREWKNIDLFIISRQSGLAFVIENKVGSKQSAGQLAKYIEKVREASDIDHNKLRIKGIFLTLSDEEPEDLSYASVGYDVIAELLPRVIHTRGSSLSSQVKTFIEHYIETLLEMTDMSEHQREMEKLAKTLYRQNQKLMDFIW